MNGLEQIPEDYRDAYSKLLLALMQEFSLDKRSGKAIVNFKEGVPMDVEPSRRIVLNK